MISKVLILDDVGREAVLDTLRAASVDYYRELLKTSPSNWASIVRLLDTEGIDAVIGVFSETALFVCRSEEYDVVFAELVDHISRRDHLILVYETNLDGTFTWYSQEERYSRVTDEDVSRMQLRLGTMIDRGLNVVPYRKRAEKTLTAQAFLDGLIRGMLLRLYVPNERIYSHEIDKFVALFTSYAQKVLGSDLSVEQHRTSQGMIYTFHSAAGNTSVSDLARINEEFTTFLDMCAHDITKAEDLIVSAGIAPREAAAILQRYAVEARRLKVDIRHEQERRLLSIRQRLESELSDTATANELGSVVEAVHASELPSSLGALASPRLHANVINIVNPQMIGHVQGIVTRELAGNIQWNENDEQLLALIEQTADSLEALELSSALAILKDRTADRQAKTSGWQKLRQFLARRGEKIEDTALKILQEYILGLLKGTTIPS